MKRRSGVVWVTITVIAVSAIGFSIGRISSPTELRKAATAPRETPITSTVESRVLRETITGRGLVVVIGTQKLAIQPGRAARSIVTKVGVTAGDALVNGEFVLEVSGRPRFVLDAEFDPYRDIGYLDEGPDVRQLQASLRSLGYKLPEHGRMDAGSIRALVQFYQDRGYEPPHRPSGSEAESGGELIETPYIPLEEWMAVPTLPQHIEAVVARVGQDITEEASTVQFSDGEHGLTVRFSAEMTDKLTPGTMIEFTPDEISDESDPMRLRVVGTTSPVPTDPESGKDDLIVLVEGNALRELESSVSGRVDVIVVETGEVLAVPSSALERGSSGNAEVVTIDGEPLPVRVGKSADGWVEIEGPGITEGLVIRVS